MRSADFKAGRLVCQAHGDSIAVLLAAGACGVACDNDPVSDECLAGDAQGNFAMLKSIALDFGLPLRLSLTAQLEELQAFL